VKLLLVEDDHKIASAVRRGLEGEGFCVEHAVLGVDGLWLATEAAYDLIVLDIMLPGRNGFEICRELRARHDWTPILMLTAKDGDLDEAEALDTGADDYLVKPFSYPVLVARIRALLRRAAAGAPTAVRLTCSSTRTSSSSESKRRARTTTSPSRTRSTAPRPSSGGDTRRRSCAA
jgi:DNA-binding response OmpR family regulator